MLKYKSPIATNETPTNNGGFLGGLGYLGNKVGIGFMQTFEGAWDYAAGGIADLFGADEWARRQMENDWFGDWYYSADKNFNPGKGWKAAGDVAGGVGNQLAGVSAAALAVASAVGITMATGGGGLPVSAAVIGSTASGITAGLAAAGNSTKEAYAKTGELTGKEYGYGTLVGATEGVIEAASNLIAPGAGKVGKGLYKAIAGEAAENAAKTGLSKVIGTAVKHAGTNFISEAVEEGTAEFMAPQYAKLTYDPNAENATAEEIAYASFIGGLSGVLAGGGEAAILGTSNSVANYRAGKKAVEAGYTAEIEGVAKRIAEEEAKKPSGYALFEKIREVYERPGSGYGRIGALQRMTAASRYLPAVEESAKAIVSNPEYSAARFLAIGAKNPDGTPLEITPEKLTEGFDRNADSETALHSLRRALSTNPLLLTLAVADATGKMMLDAENYAGLLTGGGVLTTRGDYQTFLAQASDEKKAAVAQHFGLTAPLDAIPYEDMVNIATGYAATPEGRAAIEAVGNVRHRAEQIEKNEKPLPKVVGEALADGIYRYGDVAIIKEGESVRIYDYDTRSITMAMTPKEATAALQKYRREQDTAKAEERRAKAEEQRKAREEELDTWAREHIKRYRELVGNEQREIRTLIRQGRALGLSDADIETYATVSARSSVRVTFSKAQCRRESVEMEDGKPVILVGYADGFYSPETNEIVVNPEGKRSAAKLLMHELSHALYKDRRFAEVIDGEVKHMDEKRKQEVRELYEKAGKSEAEISEDLSVHHAEDVVANRDNLARMMKEEPTLGDKILSFFKLAKTDYKGHSRLSLAAGRLYRTFETLLASFSEFNRGNLAAEANPMAMRETMADARFALQFSDKIAEGQRAYLASHQGVIEDSELSKAIEDTAKMVKKMLPHKDILPTDTVGKKGATLVKNGSYDVSVENTTVCIRTLSYNAFTDMVSEKIGRPLSQMESFLVSQKLYDIAKEPQCLYCYVSLDRKAFNEMIIRYTEQRDAAVKAWEEAGKPSVSRSSELYEKFRAGRKDTDDMWKRYNEWISAAKSGDKLITLADVATESRRADIAHNGTASQKAQIADMLNYAQRASWAKKQTKYVAYYDDILRLSPKAVKDLNKHYGLRWYSFSDYSGAFIVENMQQVTDASLRGLKGLSYTKDVDFARIFAPTGMNINISVYATDINGKWEIDPKQSADIDAAIKLREQYPNVGIVVVAAKREGVEWSLAQEWSDVVIPFHIVRSGQDVANFYDWEVFNSEQGDTVMDENLWAQYVESLGNPKKVSKSIYPSEHQNSRETYLDLCKSRGIKPRFSSFLDNPNYMKLVNETRQREADTMPLRPTFDLGAAEKSFDRFVEKGGYYEGWYNDGVDISAEVDIVAADVLAGKKANEVSYGRQDKQGNPIPTPAELMASRKANRSHGRRDALPDLDTFEVEEYNEIALSGAEKARLQSEAMTWGANEKGVLRHRTLGAFSYAYVMDTDGIVHCYGKKPSKNIHERGGEYDNENSPGLDRLSESYRSGQGHNPGDRRLGRDGRKSAAASADDGGSVSGDGKSDGRGRGEDATFPNGRKEDGSSDEVARALALKERLLSQGYYEERGYIYAPDGSKTYYVFPDVRDALPADATYVSPTAEAVGKTKDEYKADFRDKVFTAKTRTYIDTVDELYGIVTYLRKVGKIDKPTAEAMVQQARAARSQAQTMIGSAQYNIFSDKVERMGDGLLEILKPAQKWTEEKRIAFDDYLLHQLNIDRMTLESRSFVWAAPLRRTVQTTENALAALENRKKQLTSDIGKKQTALNNAKVRRGVVKTAKAKEVWNKQVDTFARELSALNDLLKEAKRDIAKKKKELGKAKEEYEAALLKNKPVFGKDETLDEKGNVKRDHDITADESRDIVKKYDAAYPEFANLAKRVYAYLDNVQNLRVEAGLITQDMADRMKQLYPHYVPSRRDVEGGGISSIKGKNAMEVEKTVRKAKGGNQDILDVSVSIAMQTDEVLKAGQINKLARALYDAAKSSGDDTYVKILSEEAVGAEEDAVDTVMRPKPGQLTFYADGKRVTLEISKELLSGFDGLRKPSVDFESPVMQALAFLNTWYKRGVTSMNPAFAIRNPIRDLQDAGLNSKHPVLFARYMLTVGKEMLQNSADWELYRAMGGFSSTVFDGSLKDKAGRSGFEALAKVFGTNGEVNFAEVFKRAKNLLKNGLTTIENINAFLEQTTRFAEFKASLAAGDSPAVALNNSAEVTTNFGRRGRITKVLNATVMPFLNPAIQGFDKLFRNVGDAFTGGHWVRGMAWLITKAAIIGIAPMLLNSLMYDDDEEYEKLRETDKENNFLIKTADGTFIKIPRGRLASVIGGLYNRGNKIAKGEDAELSGYASNVVSQITPVENVSRTIFSPIFDVKNNRTWYGGEIEGREFEDTAPRDRYDESTSWIAVKIGSIIPNGWNMSPKKIHYLLDQYSGVVGDFVLPATSKKEHRDFFSGNFTLDSVTNNKLSERFYALYDETQYADTAGDVNAEYRLGYLNRVKKSVRQLNEELDAVRADSIDNKEKMAKVRVIRALINAEYDSALKSVDAVNKAIEATNGLDTAAIEAGYTKDMAKKLRDAEITRLVFGAESALENYNEKRYAKYALFNKVGVSFDELYAFHFSTIGLESDLDKRGNVIEGSLRRKVVAAVNALNIPKEQKLLLLASRGYTPRDGDIKGVSAANAKRALLSYILKSKLPKSEREELAKACGFTVKDGKIIAQK